VKISIFGLGYVGCVSIGCLAAKGHHVVGVDLNPTKVSFINKGQPTIIEAQIEDILGELHRKGLIRATSNAMEAVRETEVSFICVGTPSTANGHLNLTAIFTVAREIAEGIKAKDDFHTVVIRSTVLPGTNERVRTLIEEVSGKRGGEAFTVVSNPEFLREGSAVKDFFAPVYTVVGTDSPKGLAVLKEVYRDIDAPLVNTDIKVAELIKYVNNSFHALKVTFANEVGAICKKIGIDSHRVMELFCQDTKLNLSSYYLKPGFSYGGSCLPKDLKALKTLAHDNYVECPVLENIDRSNELNKKNVLTAILSMKTDKIGFLGVSFKAGTDDLRNSPIIDIIEQLLGKGADVRIFDPKVQLAKLVGANKDYILKKIPFISKFITEESQELVANSDLVVVVNNDPDFKEILEHLPNDKKILDLVNFRFSNRDKIQGYNGVSW
jgi:GDP-mannose 6-dehydrogenase